METRKDQADEAAHCRGFFIGAWHRLLNGGPCGAAARLAGTWSRYFHPHTVPSPTVESGLRSSYRKTRSIAMQAIIQAAIRPSSLALRLTLYRALRHLIGPAMAFRLAFAGRA